MDVIGVTTAAPAVLGEERAPGMYVETGRVWTSTDCTTDACRRLP
jgi:hypothetical protein